MKQIEWSQNVWWMCVFMFFGLLWLTAIVEYQSYFIIITATCTFYFNNKRNFNDNGATQFGMAWTISYVNHFGTVVFGALIISIIRFIKYTILYIAQKQEEYFEGVDGGVSACILKSALCIVQCFETIADYVNESAFSFCAITGDNFCTGAQQALMLQIKHLGAFAASQFFATVFIFCGKVAVVVGNLFLVRAIFYKVVPAESAEEITSPYTVLIFVGVISYYMSSIVLGMFDTSVTAMMTCVGVDYHNNGDNMRYGPEAFDSMFHIDENGTLAEGKNKANQMEEGGSDEYVKQVSM
jgi:hypothetical protein